MGPKYPEGPRRGVLKAGASPVAGGRIGSCPTGRRRRRRDQRDIEFQPGSGGLAYKARTLVQGWRPPQRSSGRIRAARSLPRLPVALASAHHRPRIARSFMPRRARSYLCSPGDHVLWSRLTQAPRRAPCRSARCRQRHQDDTSLHRAGGWRPRIVQPSPSLRRSAASRRLRYSAAGTGPISRPRRHDLSMEGRPLGNVAL